jgi:hypothetical protein
VSRNINTPKAVAIRNAQFEVTVEEDEIVIRQSDEVIAMPIIQAEQFCAAIMQAVRESKSLINQELEL